MRLNPSHVHDAFSYYYNNQKEIEVDNAENKDDMDIENKINDIIKIALENMDKAYCQLSLINYSEIDELNSEQPTEEKYLERPCAYEFYHQLRKLIDRGIVNLGEKTVIQAEVSKIYQRYFATGKIPDFIIHIPNSNRRNLAVIEFKLAINLSEIGKDLEKLIEFKKNDTLEYTHIIEVIIGNQTSIEKARIKIEQLLKSKGEEITIIEFNTDKWTSNSIEISY